jgi:hypothetical protein
MKGGGCCEYHIIRPLGGGRESGNDSVYIHS